MYGQNRLKLEEPRNTNLISGSREGLQEKSVHVAYGNVDGEGWPGNDWEESGRWLV